MQPKCNFWKILRSRKKASTGRVPCAKWNVQNNNNNKKNRWHWLSASSVTRLPRWAVCPGKLLYQQTHTCLDVHFLKNLKFQWTFRLFPTLWLLELSISYLHLGVSWKCFYRRFRKGTLYLCVRTQCIVVETARKTPAAFPASVLASTGWWSDFFQLWAILLIFVSLISKIICISLPSIELNIISWSIKHHQFDICIWLGHNLHHFPVLSISYEFFRNPSCSKDSNISLHCKSLPSTPV